MNRWILLALLAAPSVNAQIGRESHEPVPAARKPDKWVKSVEIFLDGDACRRDPHPAPPAVSVAFDGSDEPNPALKPPNGDHWIWTLDQMRHFDHDREKVNAYVRYSNGRTDYAGCTFNSTQPTLKCIFSFCTSKPVWDLEVVATDRENQPVNVWYEREWRPRRDLAPKCCNSVWDLHHGDDIIYSLLISDETLNLRVAWSESEQSLPELLISSRDREKEPLFVESTGPRDRGKIVRNAKLCGEQSESRFSRNDIVCDIDVQKVLAGKRQTVDSFDAEIRRLSNAGVKTISLTLHTPK